MRAVVIPEYGGVEVLEVRDVPEPAPGPDEVLVDVMCSAMNRADLLQRMGLYPAPGPKPLFEIPGMEFAGRIVDVGERVAGWPPATKSWASCPPVQPQSASRRMSECFSASLRGSHCATQRPSLRYS